MHPAEAPGLPPLSLAQRLVLGLLRAYKLAFSPWFAGSCRFLPSCSEYATEAVTRFGVVRGSLLAARRLARCHPLGSHGLDPVPDRPGQLHRSTRLSCPAGAGNGPVILPSRAQEGRQESLRSGLN